MRKRKRGTMLRGMQFNIEKDGLVRGGTAFYHADVDTGVIKYQAAIKVGISFFTKTYETEGRYVVDPKLLLCETMNEAGERVQLGNVEFVVVQNIDGVRSLVNVRVLDQDISGLATVSLVGKTIELLSLDATAKVYGMSLSLKLRSV